MSNDQRRMLEYVARAGQAGGNSTAPPALTSNHRSIRDHNNDNRIACRVVPAQSGADEPPCGQGDTTRPRRSPGGHPTRPRPEAASLSHERAARKLPISLLSPVNRSVVRTASDATPSCPALASALNSVVSEVAVASLCCCKFATGAGANEPRESSYASASSKAAESAASRRSQQQPVIGFWSWRPCRRRSDSDRLGLTDYSTD